VAPRAWLPPRAGRRTGGEHQDRQSGPAGLEFGDQRAGIVAGHPLVENDRAKLHPLPRAQGGDRGFGSRAMIVRHPSRAARAVISRHCAGSSSINIKGGLRLCHGLPGQ
jgi:hypothetical protein